MFPGPLGTSLAGRGLTDGIWSLDARNIRDHAIDKHRTVDDTPAGAEQGWFSAVMCWPPRWTPSPMAVRCWP
jgi:tRNA G37 N-methylase TrmD